MKHHTVVRVLHVCIGAALLHLVASQGQVQRLEPKSGSLCGGTRLSIYGSGFSPNMTDNVVMIGEQECEMQSASETMLVCQVPFRDAQVMNGKETTSELLSVTSSGTPARMAEPLEYTFKAESAPLIINFGPTSGQANDVLSFQGEDLLSVATVFLNGRRCVVKYSKRNYLQCIPPPMEAGINDIHVYFGPQRGFACQGPRSPPLKFTYNLALQSALPAGWGAEARGPVNGEGGDLVIVGQGLGKATIFKLCGGDAWCLPQSSVAQDPEEYHAGDWSFQTVTCKPGPLLHCDIPKTGRTCDLVAEAADGMFRSIIQGVWTYGLLVQEPCTSKPTIKPHSAPAPSPVPGPLPGPSPAAIPAAVPAAVPVHRALQPFPLRPTPKVVAPAPAPVPLSIPAPAPVGRHRPVVVTSPTARAQSKELITSESLKLAANNALANVFQRIASALGSSGEPIFPVQGQVNRPGPVEFEAGKEPLRPLPPPSVTMSPLAGLPSRSDAASAVPAQVSRQAPVSPMVGQPAVAAPTLRGVRVN